MWDARQFGRDTALCRLGLRSVKEATFQRFHTKIMFTFDVSLLLTECAPYNSFLENLAAPEVHINCKAHVHVILGMLGSYLVHFI